ncbi:MAG: hypothetical protein WD794_11440 [Mycobacteriales bacterium]
MFWLLLAVLVLLSLALLAAVLLTLWRQVTQLGGRLRTATALAEQSLAALDDARPAAPPRAGPCPTCGAPARLLTSRPPARRRADR